MNNLGRGIKENEVVVVEKSAFPDQTISFDERLFVCLGGSGLRAFTMGSAIFGHWKDGSGKDRIDGTVIDKAETEKYQTEVPTN